MGGDFCSHLSLSIRSIHFIATRQNVCSLQGLSSCTKPSFLGSVVQGRQRPISGQQDQSWLHQEAGGMVEKHTLTSRKCAGFRRFCSALSSSEGPARKLQIQGNTFTALVMKSIWGTQRVLPMLFFLSF